MDYGRNSRNKMAIVAELGSVLVKSMDWWILGGFLMGTFDCFNGNWFLLG